MLRLMGKGGNPAPTIPDTVDEAAEERALAAAEADLAAGRLIPHENVRRWLQSWETPETLPCPRCRR